MASIGAAFYMVVVLDKPRHQDLIARLHQAGAKAQQLSDGDVAGALATLLPGGGADLLMGIGGTPEGVMTACAVRALGGFMQGRLAPQRPSEAQAVTSAGLSLERIYALDDLAAGDGFLVATGISGGPLLRAPWRQHDQTYTESMVIAAGACRRIIEGE